jgi:sec-independent protein translocase protein TatC
VLPQPHPAPGNAPPLGAAAPPAESEPQEQMTVIEHLEALRRVLIVAIVAWIIASAAAFLFHGWILDRLVDPGRAYFPKGAIYVLKPTGAFGLTLKVSAFGGLALAFPIIAGAFWTFIRPGLYRNERRAVVPLTVSSVVLFAAGAALAYHLLPLALRFLVGFAGPSVQYLPNADDYINFVVLVMVAFGITFEMPVGLVVLSMVGVVTSRRLGQWRRYAWLAIILVALVITPGTDPFTPLLLALPLLVLYEGSIVVIRLMRR